MNLRLSILLVVVLVIFGGTFLVLRFTDSNEAKQTSPWLYRIDEGDIIGLELVYKGDPVTYYRSPASLDWYIAAGPDDKADVPVFQQRWGGTPLLLSGPRVTRPLSDTIDDPAAFGLEPPETAVTVHDRYGNKVSFHLGIATPDKENQYARLVGDDTLFTVPIEWAEVVNRLAIDPPFGRLYRIDPQEALIIQFFKGDQQTRYAIEDGTGRWFLDGETPQLLDAAAWADALLMLSSPRLDQILAHNIDDPAKYGLTEPDMTVAVIVRQGGAHTIEFRIGNLTPDGEHRYVMVQQGSLLSEDPNLYGILNSRIDPILALATDPVLAE
jgi:hypothetical protein